MVWVRNLGLPLLQGRLHRQKVFSSQTAHKANGHEKTGLPFGGPVFVS